MHRISFGFAMFSVFFCQQLLFWTNLNALLNVIILMIILHCIELVSV